MSLYVYMCIYMYVLLCMSICVSLSVCTCVRVLPMCLHACVWVIIFSLTCPVGWGCRIQRLHLCREISPPPTSVLLYDTKQSDGVVPVMLRSTPSLPSLSGSLWPGVVAPDRVLSIGQLELKRGFLSLQFLALKLRIYAKLNCLKWNCFDF